MSNNRNPVVASLPGSRAPYPYSSVAPSPDAERRYAVIAGANDALRVVSVRPSGVEELRSIRVSQHFRAPSTAVAAASSPSSAVPSAGGAAVGGDAAAADPPKSGNAKRYGDVRDTFGLHGQGNSQAGRGGGGGGAETGGGANVTITDVAWSHLQRPLETGRFGDVVTAVAEQQHYGNQLFNYGGGAMDPSSVATSNAGSQSSAMMQRQDVVASSTAAGASTSGAPDGGGGSYSYAADVSSNYDHARRMNFDLAKTWDVDTVIAAAGSNGTVVVWHHTALLGTSNATENPASSTWGRRHHHQHRHNNQPASEAATIGQPEAVLGGHTRAVNRLAFSSRRPNLLLTASQDSTVKLWDRRASGASSTSSTSPPPGEGGVAGPHHQSSATNMVTGSIRSWFGLNFPPHHESSRTSSRRPPSWCCASTFQPRSEAVREVKWNPHREEVFAAVTDGGCLVVFDIRVVARPLIKIAAHSGEATCADWHPTRYAVVATGGGRDRSVKVWDCESGMSATLSRDEDGGGGADVAAMVSKNSLSHRSDHSDSSGANSAPAFPSDDAGVTIQSSSSVLLTDSSHHSSSHSHYTANVHTVGPPVVPAGTPAHTIGTTSSGPSHPGMTMRRSFSDVRNLTGRSVSSALQSRSAKIVAAVNLHKLSVSSPVTRLRWRPPSGTSHSMDPNAAAAVDRHDAMIAVATAPISGHNAGGGGSVGLWSCHRPYLPLSVVEGHLEGAVTDFFWLDTPPSPSTSDRHGLAMAMSIDEPRVDGVRTPNVGPKPGSVAPSTQSATRSISLPAAAEKAVHGGDAGLLFGTAATTKLARRSTAVGQMHTSTGGTRASSERTSARKTQRKVLDTRTVGNEGFDRAPRSVVGTWQHILSVGRDGRCLLQSLARGRRPIDQVPPSSIALATLSSFQHASGSMQLVSVHQQVPSGPKYDYSLTGLRMDDGTACAPGVFREVPPVEPTTALPVPNDRRLTNVRVQKVPSTMPLLVLSNLDDIEIDKSLVTPVSPSCVTIAPELVHLPHFAKSYQLHCDSTYSTKSALCLHNANVADGVSGCGSLARMWRMLAALLEGSHLDEPIGNRKRGKNAVPKLNAMSFVLWPTLRSLLTERANAGDVQTCVAICEVVGVLVSPTTPSAESRGSASSRRQYAEGSSNTRVPGLDLSLVREWYLSYIDILQQGCLFSQSTELIRTCRDPVISALNRNSTTIHECCPGCGKPVQGVTTWDDASATRDDKRGPLLATQRACRYCRQRIGLCFLCHEPVKDSLFVWCPGCGHGGHLHHALEWFGGENGQMVQEVCPTGCGHKCNLLRQITSFPKTASQFR